MSNQEEAAKVLAELDQFATGLSDLLGTPEGRHDALVLFDKLGVLTDNPLLWSMLTEQEQQIILRMASLYLGERMMGCAAREP